MRLWGKPTPPLRGSRNFGASIHPGSRRYSERPWVPQVIGTEGTSTTPSRPTKSRRPEEVEMSEATRDKPALTPEQQAAVEAIRDRARHDRPGPDELIDRGEM